MEIIHEDVFPPPDLRNAHRQITIDQLRRNGQLVEHNHEAVLAEELPYLHKSLLSPLPPASDRFLTQSIAQQTSSLQYTQVRNRVHSTGYLRDK